MNSAGGIDEDFWGQPSTDHLQAVYFVDEESGIAVGEPGRIVRIKSSPTFVIFTVLNSNTTETLFGVFMLDVNTVWVVGNHGTILKTTDGGDNWFAQTSATTHFLRDIHFLDENRGWAVGDSGTVLTTHDGGTTWTPETSGVNNDLFETHFVDADVGYAVGSDGVILKYSSPAITVDGRDLSLPTKFALSQNYPNPFNPSTTIRFSLVKADRVILKVHNSLGQEVRTLLDQRLPSGDHEIVWNAQELASGQYYYRLSAGSFAETRKMVLVR